ncbi:hypothetical protein GLOTRDRAFT_63852 [Gloeophyllum trabeum ATCC 11539]|uniref:Glycosyltransferase family 69 protein n=1 Tax=Gloeophyllum trabeum (strain ATCC 11539 / FP-39264 / Madison 617) TaxID=670483 RepID=S7RKI1_GLOTA|nr:uncharacterized protein GLOTRDRAFT_63852 [Gloeophyllum trabeum ATCC 11539]EPQ53174.1 hypothetical protein GLOTRDRAFT_63852 [Gloeophyllum trabeum ATCC 11539]
MALTLRRRSLTRLFFLGVFIILVKVFLWSPSSSSVYPYSQDPYQIREANVLDLVARSGKALDVQRHKFLQVRMGRDEREDIFSDLVRDGVQDFWDKYQKPYILNAETANMDAQSVYTAIDTLLSLNGWVAALCPTLTRPFAQNKYEDAYDDLIAQNHLYYIGIIVHSADHFLTDQLAVIVQLSKRLGPSNIFVSMLDYSSSDSTETLTDLAEAVLTLLGIPFRIRRVPAMTADPEAAYYPLEEAHMRNLALEPLRELHSKRNIKFFRVIWLKGFTCPNDILETIKVSVANEAAMVCGMDWAKHNDFFIFSDRWRTRDILGDQFRQSPSSSTPDAGPPRDKLGSARYAQHLPFQVFCCESGTHVVDPAQSYYQGIAYRAGTDYWNATSSQGRSGDPDANRHSTGQNSGPPERAGNAPCLDSSQAWFCRDLWVQKAKEGMKEEEFSDAVEGGNRRRRRTLTKRDPDPDEENERRQAAGGREVDPDANVGSDYDAMPDDESEDVDLPLPDSDDDSRLSVPNSVFRPARIMINPRCVTTYADVSHTQLALDLFGPEKDNDSPEEGVGKYVLEDWEGAPESFICQEQRQTGGRTAPKSQRRLEFSIHDELERRM